jgi:hypothetical protein
MVVNFASVKRPCCTIWASLKNVVLQGFSLLLRLPAFAKATAYTSAVAKKLPISQTRLRRGCILRSPKGAAKARQDAG